MPNLNSQYVITSLLTANPIGTAFGNSGPCQLYCESSRDVFWANEYIYTYIKSFWQKVLRVAVHLDLSDKKII